MRIVMLLSIAVLLLAAPVATADDDGEEENSPQTCHFMCVIPHPHPEAPPVKVRVLGDPGGVCRPAC